MVNRTGCWGRSSRPAKQHPATGNPITRTLNEADSGGPDPPLTGAPAAAGQPLTSCPAADGHPGRRTAQLSRQDSSGSQTWSRAFRSEGSASGHLSYYRSAIVRQVNGLTESEPTYRPPAVWLDTTGAAQSPDACTPANAGDARTRIIVGGAEVAAFPRLAPGLHVPGFWSTSCRSMPDTHGTRTPLEANRPHDRRSKARPPDFGQNRAICGPRVDPWAIRALANNRHSVCLDCRWQDVRSSATDVLACRGGRSRVWCGRCGLGGVGCCCRCGSSGRFPSRARRRRPRFLIHLSSRFPGGRCHGCGFTRRGVRYDWRAGSG
jgi:hypothetical protein